MENHLGNYENTKGSQSFIYFNEHDNSDIFEVDIKQKSSVTVFIVNKELLIQKLISGNRNLNSKQSQKSAKSANRKKC